VLGLVPTGVTLLGFGGGLVALRRRRGRSPDAPVVVMTLLALAAYVVVTWNAPAMVAVKGSYLLPLLVPAAILFARGVGALPRILAGPSLLLATVAALAAAAIFTTGLVFPAEAGPRFIRGWEITGRWLPAARLEEAARRLDPLYRGPRGG
jgi:hypothetical protein